MVRTWALLRIALGVAQIAAATITLIFLVRTGVSVFAMIAAIATLILVILSRCLFSKSDQKE